MQPSQLQTTATLERIATEQEMQGAMRGFEAACWRNDTGQLARATEAVHAAVQAHMDAIASATTITKRSVGL